LGHDQKSNRIDARLTTHQGMAAQQTAAMASIKLHAKETKAKGANGSIAPTSNPREAARGYFETARAEQAKHEAIREELLKKRAHNLEQASRVPTGKGMPRETLASGLHAARSDRSSNLQRRLREDSPQNQIRYTAASGRALTDAERANASLEVKAKFGREERQGSLFTPRSEPQQRGKDGGNGGGRGR